MADRCGLGRSDEEITEAFITTKSFDHRRCVTISKNRGSELLYPLSSTLEQLRNDDRDWSANHRHGRQASNQSDVDPAGLVALSRVHCLIS